MTTATTSRSKKKTDPTNLLALFFYYDICGNDESKDAYKDPNFFYRHLPHSKSALKNGADLGTLKLALIELRNDLGADKVHSIQQALTWQKHGTGMSYYQLAEQQMESDKYPPPVWDVFAQAEYRARQRAININGREISSATADNNLLGPKPAETAQI